MFRCIVCMVWQGHGTLSRGFCLLLCSPYGYPGYCQSQHCQRQSKLEPPDQCDLGECPLEQIILALSWIIVALVLIFHHIGTEKTLGDVSRSTEVLL